jgi:hypothetical protein
MNRSSHGGKQIGRVGTDEGTSCGTNMREQTRNRGRREEGPDRGIVEQVEEQPEEQSEEGAEGRTEGGADGREGGRTDMATEGGWGADGEVDGVWRVSKNDTIEKRIQGLTLMISRFSKHKIRNQNVSMLTDQRIWLLVVSMFFSQEQHYC